jgi:undecaprenyl-diphosphatase
VAAGAAVVFVVALFVVQRHWFQAFESSIAVDVTHPAWLGRLFEDVALNDKPVFAALAVAWFVIVLVRRRFEEAALVGATLVGAIVVLALLRYGFDAPRPEAVDSLHMGPSWEFPSGHAFGATVIGVLFLLVHGIGTSSRWRNWMIAAGIGFAVGVGTFRLLAGTHYVGDVITGASAGVCWACLCYAGYLTVRLRRSAATQPR